MSDKPGSSRREFLGRQAALAAAFTSLFSKAQGKEPKFTPKANTRVLGANDRINVGFIGNGMQFYGLLSRGFLARKEKKNDFEFAAACDVWTPRVRHAQEKTKAAKNLQRLPGSAVKIRHRWSRDRGTRSLAFPDGEPGVSIR